MGRRRARPRHVRFTRRGFLRGTLAALVAACGDNVRPLASDAPSGGDARPDDGTLADGAIDAPAGSATFAHGVASGDPLSDRVVLWTRVTTDATERVAVAYVVATDPQLAQIVAQGSAFAEPARDFTVKIDRDGLAAGTTYYYRFSALGADSPVGRTRTLPAGTVDRLRIGVVSCASYAHGLFNAYRRVAARADLDVVIHVGDYLYEYSSGADGKEVYGTARTYEPPTEIVGLADYRTRFAQYRRDADLQELHRQHAMIAAWDDHETADASWKDGALNHGEGTFDEGGWAARVTGALRAYYEWMPVREPAGDPRANYRAFAIGDLVDLYMLESRLLARPQQIVATVSAPPPLPAALQLFADSGAVASEERTLLGAIQETWLGTQLRASQARWRLLGQQVMLGQLKVVGAPNALGTSLFLNPDQWDGYPRARDRLFDLLADHAIDNVVVLTGDIHSAWSLDLARDPNNGLAYNPSTGAGSLAVELVATSVTSPGLAELASIQSAIPAANPHVKYVDLARNGYLLLDITPERLVGEHWFVDTIATASSVETFGAAFATADGENHLETTAQTVPRANPPPLAP